MAGLFLNSFWLQFIKIIEQNCDQVCVRSDRKLDQYKQLRANRIRLLRLSGVSIATSSKLQSFPDAFSLVRLLDFVLRDAEQ